MGNGTEICQISLECKAAFEAGLAIGAPPLGVRPWFKTAQGTFNLWAASIKATSTSKASLDYRLRNHVKVRQAICSLIKALIQSLAKCQELVAGGPSDDSANSVSDSGSDSAPSWDAISNASGVNENLASLVEPANPLLDEHVLYIKTNINQLLRISSEIRKSGNKYRFGKIDGELEENSFSDFRQHLTAVILRGFHDDKAPDLPAYENIRRAFIFDRLNKVQQRLVRANILRRNRIQVLSKTRYRPKLSTQNQPNPVLKRDAALGLVINDTEADPEPIPRPTSSDPDAQPQAGLSRTATSTAGQRTVTATEPGSHVETRVESLIKRTRTPSNITGVTRIGSTQAFPRCPAPGMDGAVMCPYCGDPLELESDDGQVSGKGPKRNGRVEHKWKYHVAQDIIPYSCISEECDTPDEMHLTAQSLVAHTIENHGVERWACDYCLSQSTATGLGRTSDHQAVFETAEDWAAHINTLHPNKIPQTKLPTFMKINKRVMLEPMGCPLCEYVCESEFATSTIDDHILQHLYEFALRALPDGNNDDESNDELSKLSQQSGSLSHTKLVQDSGPTDLSAEIARYEEKLNVMRRVDAESFVFDNVLEKHGSLKEQPLMNNLQRSIFLGSNSDESQMLKEGLKTEMFKLMMAWDSSREYLDGQLELSDGSAVSVEEIPVIYLLENLTAETVTSRGIFDFSKLSVSEISTCLSVPRHQNFPGEPPVFVGRGAILNQLEELVVDFEVAISSVTMATLSKSAQQLRVVLSGPSQAGKTAVAQQFAYNRRQDTDNKLEFWIDATSAESIGEGYADGLRLLGLLPSVLPSTLPNEDMMRMFLILLNTKLNTSFTMVFDGIGVATLHYLCFKNLLPQAFHGILLFTTTDTDCLALLGYHKNIHVGHCSEVELAKTKGRSTLFFGIDFGTT
ncbi:hypothetical protein QBC43DRAFT_311328 [Cladorrhinum sp. PSN259]|nr:hypothetical protein QBC43DRAFT_311328 [Cladorrhinum sp. PSN259]